MEYLVDYTVLFAVTRKCFLLSNLMVFLSLPSAVGADTADGLAVIQVRNPAHLQDVEFPYVMH